VEPVASVANYLVSQGSRARMNAASIGALVKAVTSIRHGPSSVRTLTVFGEWTKKCQRT
jgi:hypothetical protein